jgi:ribosomal silencing factor RsfS
MCDLCRLNNFLMVEKSRKIRDYMVLVTGQAKRNVHNSVGKATFLEWVKEMTRQF